MVPNRITYFFIVVYFNLFQLNISMYHYWIIVMLTNNLVWGQLIRFWTTNEMSWKAIAAELVSRLFPYT